MIGISGTENRSRKRTLTITHNQTLSHGKSQQKLNKIEKTGDTIKEATEYMYLESRFNSQWIKPESIIKKIKSTHGLINKVRDVSAARNTEAKTKKILARAVIITPVLYNTKDWSHISVMSTN
eukprot:snap_masked-scaffold_8-processed-gene-14.38-mRNA-1 protein AED:1.00 eAED:1.00 QI:0/0/0/0/1/1/2/0/122